MDGQCDKRQWCMYNIILRIFALTILPYPPLTIIQYLININYINPVGELIVSGFRKPNVTANVLNKYVTMKMFYTFLLIIIIKIN